MAPARFIVLHRLPIIVIDSSLLGTGQRSEMSVFMLSAEAELILVRQGLYGPLLGEKLKWLASNKSLRIKRGGAHINTQSLLI